MVQYLADYSFRLTWVYSSYYFKSSIIRIGKYGSSEKQNVQRKSTIRESGSSDCLSSIRLLG